MHTLLWFWIYYFTFLYYCITLFSVLPTTYISITSSAMNISFKTWWHNIWKTKKSVNYYLQTFKLVFQEVELPHVHSELLLGVGGVVLLRVCRQVVRTRHFLRRRRHRRLTFQILGRLAEDDLRIRKAKSIFKLLKCRLSPKH